MTEPSETTWYLLKYLQAHPQTSQRELADMLGVSLGKLNYCLKALIEKGWVKVGNFSRSPRKKGYAYLLTPRGIQAKTQLTVQFLQRKMDEYDRLRQEIEALQQEIETSRV
uniref:MarR family EPS-associated transcriptional regulator n=1 Tax=Desulfatirhabdium butyrativorans TaxID=340467 RepID=A0A7C4VS13_9BACT